MGKKSLLSRSFVYAVAVSSLTAFGCGEPQSEGEDVGVSQAALADFDGEALFRGLVMMDGEAGEMIPEIRNHFSLRSLEMSEGARAEISESQNLVIEIIHELEPRFFDQFKEKITSGEHELVAKALEEGSLMLLTAARKAVGYERFKKFFEEFPLTLTANEYLPEGYEGVLHPNLAEFLKGNLLTIDGRLHPIPNEFSAFQRGFALDAAVDVNWFLDRAVNIHIMIDIVRAYKINRIVFDRVDYDRIDFDRLDRDRHVGPIERQIGPIDYHFPLQRLDRMDAIRINRLTYPDMPGPIDFNEFQDVILEKLVDSIAIRFR